ncbi:MAG: PDZ domain-containing protein [Ignavibacteria bacterium]|nr:PDZ domain-containing protein [Ignavibacteria bacterium]
MLMKTSSLLIALCSLLLTGSSGLIAGCKKERSFLKESEKAQKPRTELMQKNDAISNSRQTAITETVRIASTAIVGITVTEVRQVGYSPFGGFFGDPFFDQFFNRRRNMEVRGAGSGFIISSDGYIVTNDHVAGNAKKIVITMTNGKRYDARIIGSDPVSDVALLKIEGEDFPFLQFGNSEQTIIGEWAIAFGNPFGLFDNNAKPTVTVGVISNSGVSFTQENRVYKDMLQTDAAISTGNSGGPLLNARGEVIGVNTVIFSTANNNQGSGSIGIGFAVPINRVKSVLERLKEDGKIDRDFNTGMLVQQIDDRIARYFQLEKKEGVVVVEVRRGTPAEKAGIEPGDIILEVDGKKIDKNDDLELAIYDGIVGQTMILLIDRGGETMKKKLYLERSK